MPSADADRPARATWVIEVGSWASWIAQPWRSLAVIVALVGALSLPAVVLASGAMFERSSSDSIATAVIDELSPTAAGLTVTADGRLSADQFSPLATAIEARLATIEQIEVPPPVLLGREEALAYVRDGEQLADVQWRGQLFARAGAIDALPVIDGEPGAEGAWISEWLAAETGMTIGDLIQPFGPVDEPDDDTDGGPPAPAVPVVGIYADLWATELGPYWDDVPVGYLPRFLRVFQSPSRELIVVPESTLVGLGPIGRVDWSAPLVDSPTTYAELRALDRAYARFRSDLVRDDELVALHEDFALEPRSEPSVSSQIPAAADRVDRLIAEIEPPIRAATIGGTIAGILLSTMGAVFLVRRERRQYRLLAADGDGVLRFAGRAVAQLVAPALLAIAVGYVAALGVVAALGPSGTVDTSAIAWDDVLLATSLAVALGAAVTGVLGPRLADGLVVSIGNLDRTWVALVLGATAAMWIQVGREGGDDVNPLIVAFPLVSVVAGVVVVVMALRALLRLLRRTGHRLPLPVFIAWRALTASDAGALMLTGALGVATGFAVLSSLFVTSIDVATDAKAFTVVGAPTQVELIDPIDPELLPDESTVVRRRTTSFGDGGNQVDLVAIDPATIGVLTWPDEFGLTADQLVAATDGPSVESIPAVVVGQRSVPTSGEFGVVQRFPYEVVASTGSVPLAAPTRPTLVMRTDVLERYGIEGTIAEGAGDGEPLATDLESPLDGFSRVLLSNRPADEVAAYLDDIGVRTRSVTSLGDALAAVDTQSTRWAFDFLRLLAAIAAVAALGSLALYLSERRAEREVTAVMTAQMGVRARTMIMAAIIELVGLVALSLAAGTLAAWVSSRRVFPSFEPNPEIPPVARLHATPGSIALIMGVLVTVVAVLGALSQRSAGNAQRARVLRDG